MRRAVFSICILTISVAAAHGQMTTIIDDDFESGLGAWIPRAAEPSHIDLNGTPILFEPNDPRLYDVIPEPDDPPPSRSAGFSSDLDSWDNTLAAWLEKQFTIPYTGKLRVRIEADVYVYKDPNYRIETPKPTPDPWAVGNRIYVLTDSAVNNPCLNFDGNLPDGGIRKSFWPGVSDDSPESRSLYSGRWRHVDSDLDANPPTITTTTGNFEVRLLLHDKYKGKQAVAWDNVVITLRNFDTDEVVYTLTEDFESGLGGWTAKSFEAAHPHDDTPTLLAADDSRLFANEGNPGSTSVGFVSLTACPDNTRAAWISRLFPSLLPAGTYMVEIDMDAYVYKDPTKHPDKPEALGNRVLVLTDDNYDQPTVGFHTGDQVPDVAVSLWRGSEGGTVNGVWQRVSLRQEITTTTGNFEVRLLMQDQIFVSAPEATGTDDPQPWLWAEPVGPQVVAWDNVQVRIGPGCYEPRFDRDGDGDVDQDDFAEWQRCFTGASGIFNADRCRCLDADGNERIDLDDLTAFELCAAGSGPMVPADPACDDAL
ncbi:MAG TPA: hypothetical protein PKG54_18025 [Phycisphaerae bacterium]|nr:hypothetical protein [Phycisphaerae bacterium]HOB76413.1 hypothetical protein [Phycisphaerae bacterium]HOL25720.1 hypothetical protein [Phycisphaerae bacterium]HPP19587.1 hypothetical protein [Phycisphaerae bacterium]HPU32700.1 hypothetical protein [Phycisphaerae bacterium]